MHSKFLINGNIAAKSYLENFFFYFEIMPSIVKEILFPIITNFFNKEI